MAFFGNGYKALRQGGQFVPALLDNTFVKLVTLYCLLGSLARWASVPDTLAAASSVSSDSRSAVRATFSAVFSTRPPDLFGGTLHESAHFLHGVLNQLIQAFGRVYP